MLHSRSGGKRSARCKHVSIQEPEGLALISIGNTLRADDGVATVLCKALPQELLARVCSFDLGTHTGLLAECLRGHKAAIIVDSTKNDFAPGSVSMLNLQSVLERPSLLSVESSHGFSFFDELRICSSGEALPERLLFFGVEASSIAWSEKLSDALETKVPQIIQRLSLLVTKILEEINEDA